VRVIIGFSSAKEVISAKEAISAKEVISASSSPHR